MVLKTPNPPPKGRQRSKVKRWRASTKVAFVCVLRYEKGGLARSCSRTKGGGVRERGEEEPGGGREGGDDVPNGWCFWSPFPNKLALLSSTLCCLPVASSVRTRMLFWKFGQLWPWVRPKPTELYRNPHCRVTISHSSRCSKQKEIYIYIYINERRLCERPCVFTDCTLCRLARKDRLTTTSPIQSSGPRLCRTAVVTTNGYKPVDLLVRYITSILPLGIH